MFVLVIFDRSFVFSSPVMMFSLLIFDSLTNSSLTCEYSLFFNCITEGSYKEVKLFKNLFESDLTIVQFCLE